MNTHSPRLIFNPTLGQLIAVAETNRSSGKSGACGSPEPEVHAAASVQVPIHKIGL